MPSSTILVTGATDGIGKETALVLAGKGHTVIVHGRNPQRVADTCEEIKKAHPEAKLETVIGDFSSLENIAKLAEEVKSRFPTLNVLINNAGVMTKEQKKTDDGFELHWGINHLGPVALTMPLLPVLKANQPSRIIMVASLAHFKYGMISFSEGEPAKAINYDDLQGEQEFVWYRQYGLSKLGNVMFAQALHRRLHVDASEETKAAYKDLVVHSLHPGVIDTKLMRSGHSFTGAPAPQGALASIMLANDDEFSKVSGKYYNETNEGQMNPIAEDPAELDKMWALTMKTIGLQDGAIV